MNNAGVANTGVGYASLRTNTDGAWNTALGSRALVSNITGNNNTAAGAVALRNNTTGFNNTAAGVSALGKNTTGYKNSAIGRSSLFNNISGNENTATGHNALAKNTTGERNTATGNDTLAANTVGSGNTAMGKSALRYLEIGSNDNTALGNLAGELLTTGNNNLYLDSMGAPDESETIRIGDSQEKAFIQGIREVPTGMSDAITVVIDSAGQLGTVSSSRRYKDEIRDMESAGEALLALRPVTFRYRLGTQGTERPLQYGLIAEEVAEVFPALVVYDREGKPHSVKYRLLSTLLLNELQDLRRQFQIQTIQLDAVNELIERQQQLTEERLEFQRRLEMVESTLLMRVRNDE